MRNSRWDALVESNESRFPGPKPRSRKENYRPVPRTGRNDRGGAGRGIRAAPPVLLVGGGSAGSGRSAPLPWRGSRPLGAVATAVSARDPDGGRRGSGEEALRRSLGDLLAAGRAEAPDGRVGLLRTLKNIGACAVPPSDSFRGRTDVLLFRSLDAVLGWLVQRSWRLGEFDAEDGNPPDVGGVFRDVFKYSLGSLFCTDDRESSVVDDRVDVDDIQMILNFLGRYIRIRSDALDGETAQASVGGGTDLVSLHNRTVDRKNGGDDDDDDGIILALKCISAAVRKHGVCLPSEFVARAVVGEALLPVLRKPFANGSGGSDISYATASMGTISAIIKNQRYASAVLSPLSDVSDAGEETARPNPLRGSIFRCLELHFAKCAAVYLAGPSSRWSVGYLLCGMECTQAMVNAAAIIHRDHHGKDGSRLDDINLPTILRQVCLLLQPHTDKSVESDSTRCEVLKLLKSLLAAYPKSVVSHWELFIPCGGPALPPPLLHLIDVKAFPPDRTILALSSLTSLLKAMADAGPWIASAAGRRVKGGISAVCAAIDALLLDGVGDSTHPEVLSGLLDASVAAVVTAGPASQVDPFSVEGAVRVLSRAADLFFSAGRATVPARRALVSCCGGRPTQDGQTVPMAAAMEEFLRGDRHGFMREVAAIVSCGNGGTHLLQTLEIVAAVARTCPRAILDAGLPSLLLPLLDSENTKIQLAAHHAIEKLMCGRPSSRPDVNGQVGNDSDGDGGKFRIFLRDRLCPRLLLSLSDKTNPIRRSALGALGGLGSTDWESFHHGGEDPACSEPVEVAYLSAIVGRCIEDEPAAEVRASACRAIGHVCATVPAGAGGFDKIWATLSSSMRSCLRDSNQSVRCMALLAVGNLVQAATVLGTAQEGEDLVDLCNATVGCIYDKNEKIISSAIRTLGHIIYCYHSVDVSSNSEWASLRETMLKISEQVISIFAEKIKVAVDLCQGDLVGLSWKSRSTINKHAWGSCYSLSHILRMPVAEEASAKAVGHILKCVASYREINTKVLASAVSALKIPPELLWSTRSFIELKCRGLLTCVCILSEIRPYQKLRYISFQADIKLLLMKLLRIANSYDIKMLLQIEEFQNEHLQWCYLFLSQVDVGRKIFEIFAQSIHECMPMRDFDVSLYQMFKSRSVQEERTGGIVCADGQIAEDDEL